MVIFSYVLLLLLVGLVLRVYEMSQGTYNKAGPFVVEEVISLSIACFGMLGLWGYARDKKFFVQRLWQAYFIFNVATFPIAPFISPKFQQVLSEHGMGAMLTSYAMATALALPAFWGYYSYAFRKKQVWATV